METLDKRAPKKTKMLRGNHKAHIKNDEKSYKKNKMEEPKDILKYKKQCNCVVN